MADPRGFMKFSREGAKLRAPGERQKDFSEAYLPMAGPQLKAQATRCMTCGVPFCHQGCPLGNPIPEFNDLVQQERWHEAYLELSRTNPFPEFTGKVCPAPCEDACVLAYNDKPVTIKSIELAVIERAFEEGWVTPPKPTNKTNWRVAVVGSGPAGLAAATSLCESGHSVTVFEKSDRLGGLLRYGVPDYKMQKAYIDRRIENLVSAGVEFHVNCEIGRDRTIHELQSTFDAVILCVGALKARDLVIPGRELDGVRLAMDYLTAQNMATAGDPLPDHFNAAGKNVVILGGGDTGADCYGTTIRQGAKSVVQLNHYPNQGEYSPLREWPNYEGFKHSFVYDEGGTREWGVQAVAFKGDGKVEGVEMYKVWLQGRLRVPVPNSLRVVPAEMVLLAIGFEGSELGVLGMGSDGATLSTGKDYQTDTAGVFAAGDARRGASLIVWAIAEGLNCARAVDRYLQGSSRLHQSYAEVAWRGLGR